jgi:hypothetical protein
MKKLLPLSIIFGGLCFAQLPIHVYQETTPILDSAATTFNLGAYFCGSTNNCSVVNESGNPNLVLEYAFVPGYVIGPQGYYTLGYVRDFALFQIWEYSLTDVVISTWTCVNAPNPTLPSQTFVQTLDPTFLGGVITTGTCLYGVFYTPTSTSTPRVLPSTSLTYTVTSHPYHTFRGTKYTITSSSVTLTQ